MMLEEPDNDLWEQFISGNQSAFSKLYARYADVLYAFGLRYTSDTDQVKDCIHDLFIDLHHYRHGLAKEVNVKFYLLKSYKRKLNAASRKSSMLSLNGWNTEETLPISNFSFNIEQEIILDERQKEMLHMLATQINQLPERQREILYLKFTHNLEYEEIASLMQISVPTCRTFVYRALKELRGKLELTTVLLLLWF
ncbi:RNA polymerase sigma factor [Dyadobacter psychrotolerans]|uniref:Sigma-70 family RNA polymerase sigma factor n=1 Tax=Dyadobacter psychrotolerans TaxID=2541721 RepID=A0A4R5DZZ8_9BACT|nr:sigma-70 family RNA polymerase sigma factor [Dyadobacter psychrotolerans]TDE18304.1 sigma-70 family RNA polymerase sigma factor [Dyadobacter psychrotolerans]